MSPGVRVVVSVAALAWLGGAHHADGAGAGAGATATDGQPPSNPGVPALADERNQPFSLDAFIAAHRLTVVVFYAAGCPCFAVHVPRLLELERTYRGDDVGFVVVDSERHAPPEPGAPVLGGGLRGLRDPSGALARRLDAKFATETFVFDSSQRLRYRGGIDGDREYLSPKPKAHLQEALRSLLTGAAPASATSKALGCALKLW